MVLEGLERSEQTDRGSDGDGEGRIKKPVMLQGDGEVHSSKDSNDNDSDDNDDIDNKESTTRSAVISRDPHPLPLADILSGAVDNVDE
jgi:hypothetical protein